ncbi:spaetzle domain-containing protein [Phthorimaea operculella]|nr:spaetzle domain-containing protein [Phthorimaea operculella]
MTQGLFVLFVIFQSLHLVPAPRPNDSSYLDPSPIKYPGPVKGLDNKYGSEDTTDPATNSVIPDECQGKTFCTVKPPDYPEEQFNSLFKGKTQVVQVNLIPPDTLDNRQGDPSETDGCETTVSYEPLYQVRARRDGTWRTVVQSPQENFVQRVRLEECKNTKQKCFPSIIQDLGIETFCKQKYNVWEVLVSDGKGGTERIKTELPVCCSCHYRI